MCSWCKFLKEKSYTLVKNCNLSIRNALDYFALENELELCPCNNKEYWNKEIL